MKANAPEKLYFGESDRGLLDIYSTKESGDDIEYTRTDAFIKRACEWLKENKDKYLYNKGSEGEYIPTCSDQIIGEFRKYMKEE